MGSRGGAFNGSKFQIRADTTGSVVRVLEYFYIPRGTEDEFWQRIDQNRSTKLPTTAFSDKSHSNSKKVKTKKNKMRGWIENGP